MEQNCLKLFQNVPEPRHETETEWDPNDNFHISNHVPLPSPLQRTAQEVSAVFY